MSRNLNKAFEQQKKKTQQTREEIYGTLGIPLGGQKVVEVLNRNSYVYVKLRDNPNEVIQAFNNKVAQSYGLPVIVHREGNRYIIQGVNTQRYENNWYNSSPYLPRHGTSHSFPDGGGGDVTWIFPKQIMMSLVYPNSITGTNVKVFNYPLLAEDNTWKYTGGTGTINLLGYVPTSGSASLMSLIYLDAYTGNPGVLVNSGTYFSYSNTGSVYPYLPIPSSSQIPLAGVRLSTGMHSIEWDNIYDVRQWIHSDNSAGSIFIQDEGILLGSPSTLNFVGDNVLVTVSGTVARVFVTGSASGGGVNTGTLDARYLKLDTSNDPLTGQLQIITSVSGAIYGESRGDSDVAGFVQYGNSTGGIIDSPVLYLARSPLGTETSNFTDPIIRLYQSRGSSGTISGEMLLLESDNVERVNINPSAQGTGTLSMFDGDFQLSSNGLLLLLKNNGSSRFYVNASGTAHSNGSPLVKEAPANSIFYGRRNNAWENLAQAFMVSGTAAAETNSNDVFRCDSPGGISQWAGNITGTPSGAILKYTTTSGQEGALVPTSSSQLGKMRLYNIARGDYGLISSVNTATDQITLTANVPAGWTNGDVINITSQTVSGLGANWVDIEITSGLIGKLYPIVHLHIISNTINDALTIHPFETPVSASKFSNVIETTVGGHIIATYPIRLISNVFSLAWSGTPTAVFIRESGYLG